MGKDSKKWKIIVHIWYCNIIGWNPIQTWIFLQASFSQLLELLAQLQQSVMSFNLSTTVQIYILYTRFHTCSQTSTNSHFLWPPLFGKNIRPISENLAYLHVCFQKQKTLLTIRPIPNQLMLFFCSPFNQTVSCKFFLHVPCPLSYNQT